MAEADGERSTGCPVHGEGRRGEQGAGGGTAEGSQRHFHQFIPIASPMAPNQLLIRLPPAHVLAEAARASGGQPFRVHIPMSTVPPPRLDREQEQREREREKEKVKEALRREAIKNKLTLLSSPVVSYEAADRSATICWTGVRDSESNEEETMTEEKKGGGGEKSDGLDGVEYRLTMQEEEVRKELYRGSECEYTVNGLLPGHNYTFSLIACLGDVCGGSSPPYNLSAPPEPPSQPAPPRIANRSKTAVMLRWTAPADNGASLDQYRLEWDKCGGEIVEAYCGKDKQHKIHHKFSPGTVAKFRVSAHNLAGWSQCSDWTVYEVQATASVPSAPSPPSLVVASVNSLSLSWEQPESHGAPISSYTLQMNDPDTGYGYKAVYQGEEREFTCEKLQRVTKYSFRVAAVNSKGTGPFSTPSECSTLPDKPGPPPAPVLSGKAHSTSLTISWSPPHDTGGSDIDSYRLLVDDGIGGDMAELYHGNEMSFLVQGLTPGQTYCCKVSAVSVGGEGVWSPISKLTTPSILPTCPLQPRFLGKITATHATLHWDPPEFDGGAPVISYTVQGRIVGDDCWAVYGTVANPEAFSTGDQLTESLSLTISSLVPGTNYEFRVLCANRVGSSLPSTSCQCVSAAGPPDPPAGLRIVTVSALTAVLVWQPSAEHGTPATGYQLEYWLNGADTGARDSRKQFSVTTSQATVKGLSPACTYQCRVRATSGVGSSAWSEFVLFTTTPSTPNPPQHLSVLKRAPESLLLVWASPQSHGSPITSYMLEVVGRQELIPCSSSETQFTLQDLQPDTMYRFRLQAENVVGKGPFTPYVTGSTLPLPPPPPILTLLSCSSSSLKLSWAEKTKSKSSIAAAGLTYTLQMSVGESSSHYTTVYRGSSMGYKLQKLKPNTPHCFRIAASSESGQGVWSTPVVFSTTPNAPPCPTGLLLRLMSDSECLLSWEAVEGKIITYEAQYRKTGSQDFKQVYGDSKTSCVVAPAVAGSSCEARVRAVERVTVNGREELLFSPFSALAVCSTPLPPAVEEEPTKDHPVGENESDSSIKQQQGRSLREWLQDPKCISALLMLVVVGVGVLLAVVMAQFIN